MSSPKNSYSNHSLQGGATAEAQFAASQLYDFEDDGSDDGDDGNGFAKFGDDVGVDIYDDFDNEELLPHVDAVLNFDDVETDIERLFAAGGLSWHFEREVDSHAP